MLNMLRQWIKYGLYALLFMVAITLLMQCSEGEELIPESTCKPETCEFKVTEKV
ncbi:TPA: hypothetical protein PWU90_002435 [Mannheimia haemolytica]|uniref:hypothetical protein n=1 Tax=Mannheimia haemolytica TaxID=75985 RepID=UPI0003868315|nr:hypothetical protein [Mannheimia haemolytica]EPZ01080.1 hypothetical protein L278_04550 [Mannheimia haemolytica D35]MCB4227892.1 hypothetical protein [Mannheimia haemolytica]MDW0618573.1 hypothetical protein [Mannheimia haemolytica]MDW0737570.1 hypothetical protein [Mannheimia haemolytica]NBB68513.1 hypothetical protein [Mannheimia haemolytica]